MGKRQQFFESDSEANEDAAASSSKKVRRVATPPRERGTIPKYVACCVEHANYSRDTDTYSKRFDVFYPAEDPRIWLLLKHSLNFMVMPRPLSWEHHESPEATHLYLSKSHWSGFQFAIYQSLAAMVMQMIEGEDATSIYNLAGQGAFEVRPETLVLVTEAGLNYCTEEHSIQKKQCRHSRYCTDYNAPVPTCHCDVLNFVHFSEFAKLKELSADLTAIGWAPQVHRIPRKSEDWTVPEEDVQEEEL